MQKSHLLIVLSILFVAISAFVVWFSISETSKPQELRGQAYGDDGGGGDGGGGGTCSEKPVNVQFRMYTGQDDPWINGSDMHPKVGDYIEVNCFARNGSALLNHPQMSATLTIGNQNPTALTLSNPNSAEVRHYQVTAAGRYTFTCKNNDNTCHDTDNFIVVSGPSPTPTASVTPSPSPSSTCAGGKADINCDGKVDINDYAAFVMYYRQGAGL